MTTKVYVVMGQELYKSFPNGYNDGDLRIIGVAMTEDKAEELIAKDKEDDANVGWVPYDELIYEVIEMTVFQ